MCTSGVSRVELDLKFGLTSSRPLSDVTYKNLPIKDSWKRHEVEC